MGAMEDQDGESYSLEELAAATGLPARTIRFYRQSGLIEPPERDGRRVRYDVTHLERLRTIAELRERGFGLDAIGKILADPDRAREDLPTVLQISDELRRPMDRGSRSDDDRARTARALGTNGQDIARRRS